DRTGQVAGGGIGFDDRKGTLDRHWIVLQGGNAGARIAAAYSDHAPARQGVTKALAIERGSPAQAKRQREAAPVSWREAGALSICKTRERSRTWQQLGLDQRPRQTSAMRRAGPPVASFTFANPTTSMAPEGGTLSRLATFSNPQRPEGNHAW